MGWAGLDVRGAVSDCWCPVGGWLWWFLLYVGLPVIGLGLLMDFLIECAKIGLGITSVIKEFSLGDLENKTLVELPLDIPIPPRYIGIIYKNSSNLSIAAKTLIDFLRR